jgi:hypothetical protein
MRVTSQISQRSVQAQPRQTRNRAVLNSSTMSKIDLEISNTSAMPEVRNERSRSSPSAPQTPRRSVTRRGARSRRDRAEYDKSADMEGPGFENQRQIIGSREGDFQRGSGSEQSRGSFFLHLRPTDLTKDESSHRPKLEPKDQIAPVPETMNKSQRTT